MKILYGVQGTGNGHISRARAMARALQAYPGLEVQWLFSGRCPEQFFRMEAFGDYWWREGLTFAHRNGSIDRLATARQLKPLRLVRDVKTLPVQNFDLVITDFEPVTAWAARRAGIDSVGLGHQYAFNFNIPAPRFNWLARGIMRAFAPAQTSLGMHWSPFGQPILPPIAQAHGEAEKAKAESGEPENRKPENSEHILVYLPFEAQRQLVEQLSRLPQHFIVYGAPLDLPAADNVLLKAPSLEGFQRDLASAQAVICNSGFELIAETLQLGKPILSRPLSGQFEQEANARALAQLQLATVVPQINAAAIGAWLEKRPAGVTIQWPDVAGSIARWLASGRRQPVAQLAEELWQQVVADRSHIRKAADSALN
ncbi:hypothetical protein Maes01_00323 [Microbulbifer aestuariivivens]|uniref:Glycosyltransferase n=1 Tax=Microbulbifer aestuariivivens TaxID=1908308 RepID=A0ABP9WKN7_9GAMM